jgi:hypothetical protein
LRPASSAQTLTLAEGGLDVLLATKVKVAAAMAALLGQLVVGVGLLLPQRRRRRTPNLRPRAPPAPAPPPPQQAGVARVTGVDRLGDPPPATPSPVWATTASA